jgi:hypothetical protein
VFYDPYAYALGFRDVIAGLLICLAVAATGLACALAGAPEEPVDAADAVRPDSQIFAPGRE